MMKVDRCSAFLSRAGWVAILAALVSGYVTSEPVLAQSSVTAPDSTATRVMACTACHGEKGQGGRDDYFPRLAGKPSAYLFHQLVAFRDGQRKYPPMNYLLAYLPDSYLREMADYFAAQHAPFPELPRPDVSPEVMGLGKKLAMEGDETRHIPSCAACHGPTLTGVEPGIPSLLGLHSKYISAQLGASRYGTRVITTSQCMQKVASQLSEEDIAAVSAWLSSLPAPENPAPASAGSLKLALTCDSGEVK
ncbi:c-type cytochrome [Dyella sp. C11]|uniref:c-type cytochrome n=1 Tax=Dyella sp. C11 TaxID=2126991 RepID=UPI0018E5887E|nr:c-type cytochrome [Dyella sp. C11]